LCSAAEESVEDIAEATEARATKRVLTAHVILTTRVGIAQDFVSVGYRFETLFGIGTRVYVRVQFAGQLSVGLLDLIGASIALDTKYFVVISH
jgi:hypothetical protein